MKQAILSNLKGLATTLIMALAVSAIVAAPVSACAAHGNDHSNKTVKTEKTENEHANNAHSNNEQAETHEHHVTKTDTTSESQTTHNKKSVPGDNGTVKVHQTTTSGGDRRNEPKVCGFNLAAFGFDANQQVSWYVVEHTHGNTVLSSNKVLADGNGKTTNYSLPNGMYKLYWNFTGEHGSAKHKVFKVECPVKKPVHVTPVTVKSVTPAKHVSKGHVLATSTMVPGKGASELANTGTNTLAAVFLASFLATSAAAIYFVRPKSHSDIVAE